MHSIAQPPDAAVRSIPGLLRWTSESVEGARRLRARLVDAVAERVGVLIARRATSASAMLEDLLSLPGCERILLAPAMTAIVSRYYDGRTDAGVDAWTCLTAAVTAEQTVASGMPAARPLWTALGDAYLPTGSSAADAHWVTGAGWREDRAYGASRVLLDTVLDAFSPGAIGWLPDIATGDGTFSAAAYDIAIDKVRAASCEIRGASEHTADTISVVARVIVLRSDARLEEFRAASSPVGIGRIVLRNPHLASASVFEVVDGLVHETIHCLIDLIELDAPLVAAGFAGERATSPWTGRALDVRTYLHACFVWYGLWHFWSRVAGSRPPNRAALAGRYIALCTRGFTCDGGILAPITGHIGLLGDGVFEVLQQLQTEVTATNSAEEEPCLGSMTS
jgi:hypothetical protein